MISRHPCPEGQVRNLLRRTGRVAPLKAILTSRGRRPVGSASESVSRPGRQHTEPPKQGGIVSTLGWIALRGRVEANTRYFTP